MSEIKKLAKELQDYTRVVGSHNKHIQSVANRLVELAEQPQLNENQQIVLDWLKEQYFTGYGPAIIRTIHLLQRENTIDVSGSKPVIEAYRALDTAGEAMVVKLFADWASEQEAE